jgi:aminoglycoside 2'-N-acetyltransferase I
MLRYREELVSHLSIVPRYIAVDGVELNGVYIESVATRPEFWGRRFGTALLSAASAHIMDTYDIGAMSTDRVDFYRRAGWQSWAGRSFVQETDEVRPVRPVGTIMVIVAPCLDLNIQGDIVTDWREGDIW